MEDLKIQLDFRHKIPLSDQVQTQLRGLIQSGALQSGDQLPTVRQLAAQLRINFNTVARAYRVLDEEGWISTQQGRGTYILDEAERISLRATESEPLNKVTGLQNEATSLSPSDAISATASPVSLESIDLIETVDSVLEIDTGLSTGPTVSVKPSASDEASSGSANASLSAGITDVSKEVEINQWIERFINEAAQQGITIEELHQGIIKKLTSTQADEEVLPTKKMPRRTIKQTLKPGHHNYYSLEKPDSQKHIRRRKTVQHVRK